MPSFNPRHSELFNKYPWFDPEFHMLDSSRMTFTSDTYVEAELPMDKLKEVIARENNLNKQKRGERFIMQKLGILDSGEVQIPPTPISEYMLAVFLLRYRVADMASWVMLGSPPVPPQDIERMPLPDIIEITKFKELYFWPSLIKQAYDLTAVPAHDTSIQSKDVIPASASLKHLSLYLRRLHLHDRESIYLNIDAAAMYLGHLLEGHEDLLQSNAPKLLLEQLTKDPPIDIGRIKNPLHMALAISPIILLLPANHTKTACGRPRMLEIWQALGTDRPEWIRIAERELWLALLDLSLSRTLDTRQRIHEALGRILDKKPAVVSEADLSFFLPTLPNSKKLTPPKDFSNPTAPILQKKQEREEEEEEEGAEGLEEGREEGEKDEEEEEDAEGQDGQGLHQEYSAGAGQRNLPENMGSFNSGTGAEIIPGGTWAQPNLDDEVDMDVGGDGLNDISVGVLKNRLEFIPEMPGSDLSSVEDDTGAVEPMSEDEGQADSDRALVRKSAARNNQTRTPALRINYQIKNSKLKQKQPKKPRLTGSQFKIGSKKTYVEIIDLTLDEAPLPARNLKYFETDLKVTAEIPSRLYGVNRADYLDYTPTFHHQPHLDWFNKVVSAVSSSYSDGLPLHISNPGASIIKILDYEAYVGLTADEMQEILREKHIVKLDLSIIPETFKGDEYHVIGVTGDLLHSNRSPNGRIFNALDFPMPTRGPQPPESIATDVLAFNSTLDEPYCKRRVEFPSSSMYWGLAATANSFHYFHIDSDGFGTFIAPQTGAKYWVLARPRPDKPFSSTQIYINSTYAIDSLNEDLWDVEAILLRPGTCLFMRPNTPHLVVTPTASICHGGHFYSTSNLRRTCHGILHTFVASSLLTNTEHINASRELLRRLLIYYQDAFMSDYLAYDGQGLQMSPAYRGRVPDVFTFQGLIDVLSLCNLMELGNILHPKTYTPNGLGSQDRLAMIHGRACARGVVQWLEKFVEVVEVEDGMTALKSLRLDVVYPYLASQVAALRHYKKRVNNTDTEGVVEFEIEDLDAQIEGALGHDPALLAHYNPYIDPGTYDWAGVVYEVLPNPAAPGPGDELHPTRGIRGENKDDIDWQEAQTSGRAGAGSLHHENSGETAPSGSRKRRRGS